MKVYLGIDIGSVTTKFAVLDDSDQLMISLYLPTEGEPITRLQQGLGQIRTQLPPDAEISGVATTGSARYLGGVVIGADLVKNEITCQATAALYYYPGVQTVIEIGGQDSKIIIVRDGLVTDFGMNTVCAAGTGSFLDHQARRLNLSIEEFARCALNGDKPVYIAGKCTVFAESDMVHKQQMGHKIEDIVYGLCRALVRNYLNNVGAGKDIKPPIVFQGGVAFNQGIVRALEEALGTQVIVPPCREVMGAIGAALLVREEMKNSAGVTKFTGYGVTEVAYRTSSFNCKICSGSCEIAQLLTDSRVIARWGGRCGLWDRSIHEE